MKERSREQHTISSCPAAKLPGNSPSLPLSLLFVPVECCFFYLILSKEVGGRFFQAFLFWGRLWEKETKRMGLIDRSIERSNANTADSSGWLAHVRFGVQDQ
jgi:hypothetical protein